MGLSSSEGRLSTRGELVTACCGGAATPSGEKPGMLLNVLNCGDSPHNKECVTQNVSSAKGENMGCWGRSWAGVLGLTASNPFLTRKTRSIGRPWLTVPKPHPCRLPVSGPRQPHFRAPASGGGTCFHAGVTWMGPTTSGLRSPQFYEGALQRTVGTSAYAF